MRSKKSKYDSSIFFFSFFLSFFLSFITEIELNKTRGAIKFKAFAWCVSRHRGNFQGFHAIFSSRNLLSPQVRRNLRRHDSKNVTSITWQLKIFSCIFRIQLSDISSFSPPTYNFLLFCDGLHKTNAPKFLLPRQFLILFTENNKTNKYLSFYK